MGKLARYYREIVPMSSKCWFEISCNLVFLMAAKLSVRVMERGKTSSLICSGACKACRDQWEETEGDPSRLQRRLWDHGWDPAGEGDAVLLFQTPDKDLIIIWWFKSISGLKLEAWWESCTPSSTCILMNWACPWTPHYDFIQSETDRRIKSTRLPPRLWNLTARNDFSPYHHGDKEQDDSLTTKLSHPEWEMRNI